ncbi:MAG TPA: glycosyltransferase family 4 protein [Candidatus Bipolaricaulis sp.]|nr:glycosyltransferase family 4 protein [Candidatus Bipolaricaulis sp.]
MANSVAILSQFFYPETAAVAQLLTELAVDLSQNGIDTVAYTAQPSYHRRSRLPRKQVYRSVKIYRLFSTQFSKDRLSGRLLNGLTFSTAVLARLLFSRRRQALLVTTNPPFLLWVAWLVWLLRRREYILLVHDIYPDVAIRLGYMGDRDLIARVWRWFNRKAYGRASAIIVLGEQMRRVIERSAAQLPPVHVIHSWADGSHVRPLPKRLNPFVKRHALEGKLVVLYSGNLGQAHELETLVEAAERLKGLHELVILFIGEGAKKAKLMAMVEERQLSNVLFLPPVPYEELSYSLTAGDIGVVTLEGGVEGLCEPSKLYGYLAAGLAILALVGEKSEVAEIVERHQCGYRLDQGDVDGVVEILRYLATHRGELEKMKRSARECLEHFYDRRLAVEKYLDIIRNL